MRPLELTLIILLAIRIILPVFNIQKKTLDGISIGIMASAAFQWIAEGYRWQMLPIYLICLIMGAIGVWHLVRRTPDTAPPSRPVYRTIGGLALLFIAILPAVLLPVPQTPQPTGPYEVGTITLHLVDQDRTELYAADPGQPRQIMLKIWYPAESQPGAEPAPWLENMAVFGPALSEKLGLPSFFLDHITYARGNAIADAPLASAANQYPVLLLSHGWGGFHAQNTSLAEQLASTGYIVAAPDHTYGAVATVFPDGTVALNNPQALPVNFALSESDFLAAAQTLGAQWAGDLSFVLDTFENLHAYEAAHFLLGHMDFSRIGALGHSTGGGAVIQFCADDSRCKAVLGMDPYIDPVAAETIQSGLTQPYLAMFSEVWQFSATPSAEKFASFYEHTGPEKYRFYIEQTAHYDFTDMPAFSPLAPYLGLKGNIAGDQVLEIVNTYVLAFFDQYLLGQAGALTNVENFPEARW